MVFLRCIISRQVVRMMPLSDRYFFNAGDCIAKRSAFLVMPEPDMSSNTSVGAVQCMMTIVIPGWRDSKDLR